MNSPEERTGLYREKIEAYLKEVYAPFLEEPQRLIFEAANYSLLAGGKRLRPIFTLDFCRMCGSSYEKAMPFAAAIEMVHAGQIVMDQAVGMDSDKNTFVRLYGIEECEKRVEKYTNLAIERLDAFEDSGYVRALALSLTRRRS